MKRALLALSVFITCLLPTTSLAENSPKFFVYPKELSKKIYRSIKTLQYYDYEKHFKHPDKELEEGDIEKGRSIWREKDVISQGEVTEFTMNFRVKDGNDKGKEFSISVDMSEPDKLLFKHSNPGYKKQEFGVSAKYDETPQSRWGGLIYGRDLPGVAFFIGRARPGIEQPPLLFCPRYITQLKKGFRLKDASTELLSVTGKARGDTVVNFSSGYGDGKAHTRYFGRGVLSGTSGGRSAIKRDPTYGYLYKGDGELKPLFFEEDKVQPLSLISVSDLENAAGFRKRVVRSSVMWIGVLDVSPNEKIIVRERDQVELSMRGGICVLTFPMTYSQTSYSTPEPGEQVEEDYSGKGYYEVP